MDRTIQFHSLIKDELIYEVNIRSETPSSTVESLRKQLRTLILEAPSEYILETSFPANAELHVIKGKVSELSGFIDKYNRLKDRYSFARLKALSSHLFHRLARVSCILSEELLADRNSLQSQLDRLLVKVDNINAGPSVVSIPSETIKTDEFRDLSIQCSSDLSITKWGVHFNGTSDPRSFLERVEELREANNVTSSKLYCPAPYLFVDQALIWYRGVKDSVSNWNELKQLLLDEFEPCDYDRRLKMEIQARTQGKEEPIHIYFAIMFGLFGRLKKGYTEEEKLEILQQNIRPELTQQLALLTINTVAEFNLITKL